LLILLAYYRLRKAAPPHCIDGNRKSGLPSDLNEHTERTMNIPIVDIKPLFENDPQGWRSVEEALLATHSTIGFSVLVNHGVPATVI
jgi:hypothetical protein